MILAEAMKALRDAGDEKTRQVYIRHGAGENQFGVKFADLQKLAKRIKTDTELARQLWATGNTDARMLALMILDPAQIAEAEWDAWAASVDYYALAGAIAGRLARAPGALVKAQQWIEHGGEYVQQAGWDVLAHLAADHAVLPHELWLALVETIEARIGGAPNRARHAMNNALIAIGLRNELLREAACAAAARIGPVVVDHGDTGCKTPEVRAYIEKTLAFRAKRAKA